MVLQSTRTRDALRNAADAAEVMRLVGSSGTRFS